MYNLKIISAGMSSEVCVKSNTDSTKFKSYIMHTNNFLLAYAIHVYIFYEILLIVCILVYYVLYKYF